MRVESRTRPNSAGAEVVMNSLVGGVRLGLDRMLSIGYGLVYDYIFERFEPYRTLQREVLELVNAGAGDCPDRRTHHVLEVGCGPGNFTFVLAEAGYSAVGLDAYAALLELAREKRRATRLANVAFQHGDLVTGTPLKDESFDQVVTIHSLYVHPQPLQLLREAHRVLRPGGQVIFVNHTRHMGLWRTFGETRARQGWGPAVRSLLWVLPNTIFELARKRIGPHYWNEAEFGANLRGAGFTVLGTRRTFLNEASLLVWAKRSGAA